MWGITQQEDFNTKVNQQITKTTSPYDDNIPYDLGKPKTFTTGYFQKNPADSGADQSGICRHHVWKVRVELDRESLEHAAEFRLHLWIKTERRGRRSGTEWNSWVPGGTAPEVPFNSA